MRQNERDDLLWLAIQAAVQAGQEIMEVYASPFAVELKEDHSPLTEADKRAHEAIERALHETGLPVLSEEGRSTPYAEREGWERFWMVDPLDGTKEFVKRNGEFTVNIALLLANRPVLGVILAPAKEVMYFGAIGGGAYRSNVALDVISAKVQLQDLIRDSHSLPDQQRSDALYVVGSRSHPSEETETYIASLEAEHGRVERTSIGSSLKLCLVAEGSAHVYPRFAPTMEWDIAAGHAILAAAGKTVLHWETQKPMPYNKRDLLNDWFVAK